MGAPLAGTSVAMGTPTAGPQVASPVTHGTHIAPPSSGAPLPTSVTIPIPSDPNGQSVPASFTPVSQVVPIPVETGETDKTQTKQIQKIQIEINYKQDTDYIKYRRIEDKGMDIFYAKDGYIINEIYMNGNKRWPQFNEVKECKKVLYIINPDDLKKTLKVIYEDEPEAYDPDHPPITSTISTQDITPLTQEADRVTHTSGTPLSPGIVPQSQINLPAPHVASQQSLTPPSPISIDSSHTIGESSHEYDQTSVITPVQSVSTILDTHVELVPSSSSESSDPTGWTVPLESDKGVSDVYFDQTHIAYDDTSSLFAAAEIDFGSQHISSPQLIKTSPSGQRYVDIKMDPDELDDEQPHHGFHVEEVRGYDPDDDDDDYERIPLTQYVTDLGYRVGHLENRMDSADDTIKLLVRALDYQHDIIEFRRRIGVKTAPFGADMGRHAFFDPAAFRPATSQVSKVLDATEHPSDIKLFVLDANDDSKHVELGKDKFTVKQEGDEIQYVFESGVECKLVTFKDRTVWNHRSTDPHPLGVDYFSEDDKVVVDFEDAIVMYVKKGDLTGSSPFNIDLTEEVDSVTTDINSTSIATEINDSVSIDSQSSH
ncbi:hypothetical protein MACK_002490 [Theileria orientalis]|uniref:Uncharacterized protein n=1 Tax=Theileria orientalis TaxID=68886 RepID=A0A976MDK3_THEOR|nr:hypothetical protein MACK_002490 [Theileria orientalis]